MEGEARGGSGTAAHLDKDVDFEKQFIPFLSFLWMGLKHDCISANEILGEARRVCVVSIS